GEAQLRWIDEATKLVTKGFADALVTGPVSKHAIATSKAAGGEGFRGHTQYLAGAFDGPHLGVAFASQKLTTALVSTHIPILEVPHAVTKKAVHDTILALARFLIRLSVKKPRIAVAALNPHAGEEGLLGIEEKTDIEPGVRSARLDLE